MLTVYNDEFFMKEALKEARIALKKGEIPVGAIVSNQHQIIGRGHNQTEALQDVTAHAEIIALGAASNYLGSKYLEDCTLYVTLEPCVMCAGALFWARPSKVIYGAEDPKRGFMKHGKTLLHPKTTVAYGIMSDECSQLLESFFLSKRKK